MRWLEVNRTAGFSAAVLRKMRRLQYLEVRDTDLLEAAELHEQVWEEGEDVEQDAGMGLGLAVLNRLTELQHLELASTGGRLPGHPRVADAAALTASSQLTCLIVGDVVQQQHYCEIFGHGVQLPELKELRAMMGLLGSGVDALAMVKCCPNLERLDLGTALSDEPVFEPMEAMEGPGCSVGILCGLTALTRLTINVDGEECSEGFWRCMAAMTTLRDLYIRELDMAYFGGIVSLVDCRELTRLRTDHSEHFPGLDLKTPEGQPRDVWRRLPHEALKAALEHYGNAPAYNWDTAGALTSMTRAAAEHSLLLEDETQRLHREVQELRQQQDKQQQEAMLQENEADRLRREVLELRQQQEKQQQEAADLQATVAAMGAQLRGLLLQNSVQKG